MSSISDHEKSEIAADQRHEEVHNPAYVDANARFGGLEKRQQLEKRLLWKVDAR